ncbi:DUF2490 domain-containing protein [Legionella massiliensis]|uniref:DUF2490 domain-containing protein n=1 Tax=Legionella massiliensis TaxID=1034943 RepID=UPI0006950575|nr:DUF2490 domain-containing protein [Legionella massiliensis]
MKRNYPIFLQPLSAFVLLCYCITGNCSTIQDYQNWFNLTASGNFSKDSRSFSRFKYWLEGQERLGDDSSRRSQTLFRPGLGYDLTKHLSFWLGYAWIQTGAPFASSLFIENRTWEQLLWKKEFKYLTFSSRTRMEQRFAKRNTNVGYRARQQFKLVIPLRTHSKWSLVSSEELFWNKNNFNADGEGQGFDQNRVFVGLGYKITSKITSEIGYMDQYIRRIRSPYFNSNILSINFYVSL